MYRSTPVLTVLRDIHQYPDIVSLALELLARPRSSISQNPSSFPIPADPERISPFFQSTGPITSFILDAEVVAVERETGAFKTFQDLTARAKKDVKVEDVKVGVGVFAFDLMYLNEQVKAAAP